MSTHAVSASRYLLSNSSVLTAGQYLKSMLDVKDFSKRDFAITQLEQAADNQNTGARNYRAFMFSALEETKPSQKEMRGKVTEDLLATIVADLQVGSVLMSAGQALGEAGDGKKEKDEGKLLLDQALNALEETTPALSRGLSGAIGGQAQPGRFNFAGTSPRKKKQPGKSSDLASATRAFKKNSEEVMTVLVKEFRGVAASVIDALKKPLEKIDVFDVLGKIGEPIKAAGGMVGRLIGKGIKKIQAAIEALTQLIGNDALKKIKARVEELWNEIGKKKVDQWVNEGLGKFIGVPATREIVAEVMKKKLQKTAVDKASADLTLLIQSYKDDTAMAQKMVKAISIISSVLFLLPIAGQNFALFTAGSYFVVLSGTLLIAMDYCDSGTILQRVRGVGEIANSLRP